MKSRTAVIACLVISVFMGAELCEALAASNSPPHVSLLWPKASNHGWDYVFSVSTELRLQAEATDSDGFVTRVEFWVETNLLGVVTQPPFNFLWAAGAGVPIDVTKNYWDLNAVAFDNEGARTESRPVRVGYLLGLPPGPVVEMRSPKDGEIFATPATFEFTAEVLASLGDSGPVQFYVGTNLAGVVDDGSPLSATTPPRSVTVSNLSEGMYPLTVRYGGQNGYENCESCRSTTNTIRVVRLGARTPALTAEGSLQFEVVTSFPGRETVIQASSNLLDWLGVSTNSPSTNVFTFSEPLATNRAHRFYRVWLPWE